MSEYGDKVYNFEEWPLTMNVLMELIEKRETLFQVFKAIRNEVLSSWKKAPEDY